MKKLFYILAICLFALNLYASNVELDSDYYIENNKLNITVTAKNLVANGKGGISISFPDMKDSRRVLNSDAIGFPKVEFYEKGKKIWNREIKKAIKSKYLLSEGWTEKWRKNETKVIKLVIDVSYLDSLRFFVRTNVIANKQEYTTPEVSDFYNQQGYYDNVVDVTLDNMKIQSIKSESKDYSYLKKYVGTYDIEKLFNDKHVKSELKKLLGREFNHLKENISVLPPIKLNGGYIDVSGIAPHSGSYEEGTLCVSLYSGKVYAGIFSKGKYIDIYPNINYADLPKCMKEWNNYIRLK